MTYIYPNKHIHLTKNNLGKRVILHPSKNYTPEGVSFAPSVKKAINALPIFYTGEDNFIKKELPNTYYEREYIFYIYTPIKRYEAIIPKTADDTDISGEKRVIGDVDSVLIGKILVTSNETKEGRKIHYLDYEKQDKSFNPHSNSICNGKTSRSKITKHIVSRDTKNTESVSTSK